MDKKSLLQRIKDKLFVEFQHIQNIKTFCWIELVLILIGLALILIEKPEIHWQELSYRFFELIMITIPIAAIFQAYNIYKKTEWITIGNKQINVPLYLKRIKRKFNRQKEKYDVDTEVNILRQEFQKDETLIMFELETCNDFKTFKKKIIPVLDKIKKIEIPVMYVAGKKYRPVHRWYLGLLLRLKDHISFYKNNVDMISYIQKELNEILAIHKYDQDELYHIKKGKDYSRYMIKMNQLIRVIGMHYRPYVDDVDNHSKYIQQLENIFKENPELDEFVNNAVLKIEKKELEKWEKRIEDLELENYLIMKYKNKVN